MCRYTRQPGHPWTARRGALAWVVFPHHPPPPLVTTVAGFGPNGGAVLHFEVVLDDLGPNVIGVAYTDMDNGRVIVASNLRASWDDRVAWMREWFAVNMPEALPAG